MQDAFASWGDALCASNDGGQTWKMITYNLHFHSGQDRLLSALDFVDSQTDWAVIS